MTGWLSSMVRVLCLCILFCFSSCAKNTVSDILPTNAEVYEIIIPDSLLNISGISELEYIASFDNETHDVYTDVQLVDDEVILYLTDIQRQNLINQVKDTIDIILEDYYQSNPGAHGIDKEQLVKGERNK